jgi:hypothetical protein
MKPAKTKIYAFDSNRAIPVIGEFTTWKELEGKSFRDEFLIVEGSPGNLLSFKMARKMDAFSLDTFKEIKEEKCYNINNGSVQLMKAYPEVFTEK